MENNGGLLVGNSHSNGGIKIKTPEGFIEAEGGEVIVNRRALSLEDKFVCEGNPKEITSKINEMEGGVSWSSTGSCRLVKKAADGSEIADDIYRANEGVAVQYIKDGKLHVITSDTKDQADIIAMAIGDYREGFIDKQELEETLEKYMGDEYLLEDRMEVISGVKHIYSKYYDGWIPLYNDEPVNLDEKTALAKDGDEIQIGLKIEKINDGTWNFHFKDSFGIQASGLVKKNETTGELDYIIEESYGTFNADADKEASMSVYNALDDKFRTHTPEAKDGMRMGQVAGGNFSVSEIKDNLIKMSLQMDDYRTEYRFGQITGEEYQKYKEELVKQYKPYINQATIQGIAVPHMYMPIQKAVSGTDLAPASISRTYEPQEAGGYRISSSRNSDYPIWTGTIPEIIQYIADSKDAIDNYNPADPWTENLEKLGLTYVPVQTENDIEAGSGRSIIRSTDVAKRPSPSVSATIYPEGYRMEGNDGHMWEITVASNGVHRWKRVSEDGGIAENGTATKDTWLEKYRKEMAERQEAIAGGAVYIEQVNREDNTKTFEYQLRKNGELVCKADVEVEFGYETAEDIHDHWDYGRESHSTTTTEREVLVAKSYKVLNYFDEEGNEITVSDDDKKQIDREFGAIFNERMIGIEYEELGSVMLTKEQFESIVSKIAARGREIKDAHKVEEGGVGDEREEWVDKDRVYKKYTNGGGVNKKGGLYNIGDKVMVDDSGYIKSFEGYDLSKPATILTKNKVKTSSGIKYTYGLEFSDGRKSFNNASESKLKPTNTFNNGGGVGDEEQYNLWKVGGFGSGIKPEKLKTGTRSELKRFANRIVKLDKAKRDKDREYNGKFGLSMFPLKTTLEQVANYDDGHNSTSQEYAGGGGVDDKIVDFVKALEDSKIMSPDSHKNDKAIASIKSIVSMSKKEFSDYIKKNPNEKVRMIYIEYNDWIQSNSTAAKGTLVSSCGCAHAANGTSLNKEIVLKSKLVSGNGEEYRVVLIKKDDPYKSVIRPEKYSQKMEEWISTSPGWALGTLLGIKGYYSDSRAGDKLYIDMGQNWYVTGMSAVLNEAEEMIGEKASHGTEVSQISGRKFKSFVSGDEAYSVWLSANENFLNEKYNEYTSNAEIDGTPDNAILGFDAWARDLYEDVYDIAANGKRFVSKIEKILKNKNIISDRIATSLGGHDYSIQGNRLNFDSPAVADEVQDILDEEEIKAIRYGDSFVINDKSYIAAKGKRLPSGELWFSPTGEGVKTEPTGTAVHMIERKLAQMMGAQRMERVGEDEHTYTYVLHGNPMMIAAKTAILEEEKGLDVETWGSQKRVHIPKIVLQQEVYVRYPLLTPFAKGGPVNSETYGSDNRVYPDTGLNAEEELNKVQRWLHTTTESFDDWDWDGERLALFEEVDGEFEVIEKYPRAVLIESGAFKADGGPVARHGAGIGRTYVSKEGIKYWAGVDERGIWTVFSQGTKAPYIWEKRNELDSGVSSKEDAVHLAKSFAGVIEEKDPEAYFMAHEYKDGGFVITSKDQPGELFVGNSVGGKHIQWVESWRKPMAFKTEQEANTFMEKYPAFVGIVKPKSSSKARDGKSVDAPKSSMTREDREWINKIEMEDIDNDILWLYYDNYDADTDAESDIKKLNDESFETRLIPRMGKRWLFFKTKYSLGDIDNIAAADGKSLSYAGVNKDVVARVMHEFKVGELHDSHGNLVTDRKQAIAIALSMGRRNAADGMAIEETIIDLGQMVDQEIYHKYMKLPRGKKAELDDVVRKVRNKMKSIEREGGEEEDLIRSKAYKELREKLGLSQAADGKSISKADQEKYSNMVYQMEVTEDSWKTNNPDAWQQQLDEFNELHRKLYGTSNVIGGKAENGKSVQTPGSVQSLIDVLTDISIDLDGEDETIVAGLRFELEDMDYFDVNNHLREFEDNWLEDIQDDQAKSDIKTAFAIFRKNDGGGDDDGEKAANGKTTRTPDQIERDKEIASTILMQLGGSGKLKALTGAYNFIAIPNGVSFRLKNPRANYVKVELTGADLYNIEVGRIRGFKYTVVDKAEGYYFDMMKPFIEKATGLTLTMPRVLFPKAKNGADVNTDSYYVVRSWDTDEDKRKGVDPLESKYGVRSQAVNTAYRLHYEENFGIVEVEDENSNRILTLNAYAADGRMISIPFEEKNKFVDYVYDFYDKEYSRSSVQKAVDDYLRSITKEEWGGGDSLDREKVYNFLRRYPTADVFLDAENGTEIDTDTKNRLQLIREMFREAEKIMGEDEYMNLIVDYSVNERSSESLQWWVIDNLIDELRHSDKIEEFIQRAKDLGWADQYAKNGKAVGSKYAIAKGYWDQLYSGMNKPQREIYEKEYKRLAKYFGDDESSFSDKDVAQYIEGTVRELIDDDFRLHQTSITIPFFKLGHKYIAYWNAYKQPEFWESIDNATPTAADGVHTTDYLAKSATNIELLKDYIVQHGNVISIQGSNYGYFSHGPYNLRISGGRGAVYNIIPYFPERATGQLENAKFFTLLRGRKATHFAITNDGILVDIVADGTEIARGGMDLNRTFTYEKSPTEKWEVEYEWDRKFPIVYSVTIDGKVVDIDDLSDDDSQKVHEAAYMDYIDTMAGAAEYRMEEFAGGGFVSKGEKVWDKLTSSKRAEFLYENFTPEITPRSQEMLVGRAYNFLPKNVKIKIESKYANVEEGQYSNGGGTEYEVVLYNRYGDENHSYTKPTLEEAIESAKGDQELFEEGQGEYYQIKHNNEVVLSSKK